MLQTYANAEYSMSDTYPPHIYEKNEGNYDLNAA